MKHHLTKGPEITPIDCIVGPGFKNALHGFMEADGTHYSMTVIPISEDYTDRFLGSIEGDGFLVINGLTRRAYVIKAQGYLDFHYFADKLGWSTHRPLNECDGENVIHLLHSMIPSRSAQKYETTEDKPE